MFIPVLLLFLATLTAAVMAYGTNGDWGQFSHGFDAICWARRLQWPLIVVSLGLCVAMVGLIISGKRRAWWLIGLAPVLALFGHKFLSDPARRFAVVEDPPFVDSTDAKFLDDNDWVVGYRFADADYACPYFALFDAPVVIHTDHDRRAAVVWSAYANRALVMEIGRDLRGADLEVVSMPANALLVYNSRIGQFINGITGLAPDGKKPDGFREPITVVKTTWKHWRAKHPETKVLQPIKPADVASVHGPIRATVPMPKSADAMPADETVAIVGSPTLLGVSSKSITASPLNVSVGDVPVMLFRDQTDGIAIALDRRVDDLRPKFKLNTDRKKRPKAVFIDEDSNAGWDARGLCVDGPKEMIGKRLKTIPVEDGLNLRVMKHWLPQLKLFTSAS